MTTNTLAEPANTYVYISNNDGSSISVFSPSSLAKITDIPTDQGPSDVIVSPAGSLLYVAYDKSPYVDVFSTVDYSLVKRILVSGNSSGWSFTRMTMNTEGTKLYVSMYGDHSVYLIDAVSYSVTRQKYLYNDGLGAAKNPYGIKYYNGYVYVSIYTDPVNGDVYKLDDDSLEIVKEYGNCFKWPNDIVRDDHNNRLLVCNGNGSITVINTATDSIDGMMLYPDDPGSVGSSASVNITGYTYRTIVGNDKIAIYNTSKALVGNISLSSAANPYGVICNQYNNTVYVAGSGNGYLYVVSTETNAVIAQGFIGNGIFRVTMGTQATRPQHQVKFVVQSLFGLVKYCNATVSVYNPSGMLIHPQVTDSNGQAAFYLDYTTKYTVTVKSTTDNIDKSVEITPYDDTYYIEVVPFIESWNPLGWIQGVDHYDGAGTGDVNRDIKTNYSVNTSASPRLLTLNYSDVTASTTSVNFTLLRYWYDNKTYTGFNTTLVAGSGLSYQQMAFSVPANLADGQSWKIVVTSETGAYGTVIRSSDYHFPGAAYPIPGLPASWYPYLCFAFTVIVALMFTYISSGLGLIVIAALNVIFMCMGWLAWSDLYLILLQVVGVYGAGAIFKQKKKQEGY
jgi:DNA-binding beta-propeller fold protein YncE